MSQIDQDRVASFISDLLAVEKHTLKAVKNQKDSKNVVKDEEAIKLLTHIETTLITQVNRLEEASESYDAGAIEAAKNKLTGFLGSLAGLVDQARKDPVSKLMRDNYTAVAMITAGNTMLKSTALAVEDEDLQHVAGNNLKELARITTEISRYLPLAVARELIDDKEKAEEIGHTAIEKTQKAWNAENVKKGETIV